MGYMDFEQLPDDSRLWVFEADRPIGKDSIPELEQATREFVTEWAAHGRNLHASCRVERDRFLMVAVNESDAEASGCSIDALVNHVRKMGERLEVDFLDRTGVSFVGPSGVERVSRGEFKNMASAGKVGGATTVFDNTVQSVGALRRGEWERPASRSWHKTLLASV